MTTHSLTYTHFSLLGPSVLCTGGPKNLHYSSKQSWSQVIFRVVGFFLCCCNSPEGNNSRVERITPSKSREPCGAVVSWCRGVGECGGVWWSVVACGARWLVTSTPKSHINPKKSHQPQKVTSTPKSHINPKKSHKL